MTQAQALDILKTGANVFLTGEPGAGKTHTVNTFIRYLKKHGVGVAVTASTGIAATHLGGITIHSWSGIGIKKELSDKDLKKLASSSRLTSRAKKTHTLVIDEISMLDADTLTAVDQALQAILSSSRPFGGLQVVFVGDFFQLPPVVRHTDAFSGFAYQSESWAEAAPTVCYLSEQHRHEDDQFIAMLSRIRKGENLVEIFDELTDRITQERGDEYTQLYTHNARVDDMNSQRLSAISQEEITFEMTQTGNENVAAALIKGCLSPEVLTLKKGAQVMCTKNNFDEGYVNGTLGTVVGFSEEGYPIIETATGRDIEIKPAEWKVEDNGKVIASIKQVPLRLAWALTVHKSQGMTLDSAYMDLSRAFEYGQGYVALSRIKTLSGLYLAGINERALQVHPEVLSADIVFRDQSERAVDELKSLSADELKKLHLELLDQGDSLSSNEPTHIKTYVLYKDGKSIAEIAKARGLTESTIITHFEKLKAYGEITREDLEKLLPKELKKAAPAILDVFKAQKTDFLAPVLEHFKGKYNYTDLKLVRLLKE